VALCAGMLIYSSRNYFLALKLGFYERMWSCKLMCWQTVQQQKDDVSTENRQLMMRIDALTDILSTQENHLSQACLLYDS